MTRQAITEESGVHKEWKSEVDTMTLEKLPEFIRKLTEDYQHDYGTICHAIAAGAIATAKAMDRSEQGGITGFQASCIMWSMIDLWGVFGDGPKRMLSMSDMLFPQYFDKFRAISPETWEYLQAKAKDNLTEKDLATESVVAHWRSIVEGNVPFGYLVKGKAD